jgi:hypothetical protein
VGFKLGAWRDSGWWQCAVGELHVPPQEPRTLSQLEGDVLEAAMRSI